MEKPALPSQVLQANERSTATALEAINKKLARAGLPAFSGRRVLAIFRKGAGALHLQHLRAWTGVSEKWRAAATAVCAYVVRRALRSMGVDQLGASDRLRIAGGGLTATQLRGVLAVRSKPLKATHVCPQRLARWRQVFGQWEGRPVPR